MLSIQFILQLILQHIKTTNCVVDNYFHMELLIIPYIFYFFFTQNLALQEVVENV